MRSKGKGKKTGGELTGSAIAFAAWCEAAEQWHRLRSDAAEAECRKARAAFYTLAYGTVPPIQNDWRASQEGASA